MSLPRCRRPTAEPAHRSRGTRSPFICATEMFSELHRPIDLPGAGRGFGLSAGRTRAVALPLLPSGSRSSLAGRPSPSPTQRGRGGGWRQAGLGVTPLAGAASRGPLVGSGVRSRPPARSAAQEGYFQPGWDARPRGRAPINVPLSPLFGGRRQLRARTLAPIAMETRPGLGKRSQASVSPPGSREGGRQKRHPALCSPTEATGMMPGRWALRGEFLARKTYPLPSCQPPRGSAVGHYQHPGARSPSLVGLAPNPSSAVHRELPRENSWPCRQPQRERGKTYSNLLPQPPPAWPPKPWPLLCHGGS